MKTFDGRHFLLSLGSALAAALLVLPASGQGPSGALVQNLGGGCPGICGTPALAGGFAGSPAGGGWLTLCCDVAYLPPTDSLYSIGASLTSIDFSWLSTGCSLNAAPDVVVLPTGGGCATCQGGMGCGGQTCDTAAVGLYLAIPADPSIVGATAFVQFALVSIGSPQGLALSNTLAITFS